ncbi:SRPBCC family protein [Bergeyella sp. RCAD1439]|uniref:SRPBCC family protein n=1 Tax=Bergeyella anatis TaxID=3113737 RepID=UPI002E1725EB|nr:SRPBCC domain-containing protein [Bergeyella sp. RCAD1439]
MHDNVIVKEKVNAPVEKVWAALTDKGAMKEWYFDIPDFAAEPHTEFGFWGGGIKAGQHHHCEILEVDACRKLKYSWAYPEISKEKTIVKWELESEAEGTVVTLTHKGLENLEHLGLEFNHESFEKEWKGIVGKLKAFVEK